MKIEHVTKKMEQTIVLENVNFSLEKGELVGLIGRNGSGKTTLFRTIAGHYLLDDGEISIDNQRLDQHPQLKEQLFILMKKKTFFRPTL